MKAGCKIKMIETRSDIIWENILLEKITVQWRKIMVIVWYQNTMDIKY